MFWFLLQKIGFYVFVLLTFYFAAKRDKFNLLKLMVASLAFGNFYQYIGTIWIPYKVVVIGMIYLILSDIPKVPAKIRLFLILFTASQLVSLVVGLVFPPIRLPSSGIYKLRIFIQLYSYLSFPLIVVYVFTVNYTQEAKSQLLKFYFLIGEITTLTGLVNWVCLKIGVPFMPILRQNGSTNDVVAFNNQQGEAIDRIYGFSGEPKNLAFFILPFIFISLYYYLNRKYRISPVYHLVTLMLSIFVLINTYSSGGLICFAIGIVLIPIIFNLKIPTQWIPIVIIMGLSYVGFLTIKDINSTGQEQEFGFFEMLYNRTFVRANDELENDRQETIVFNYFTESSSEYWLTGYGQGMYNFHVPGQGGAYGITPMQSGIVLSLVDTGVIGIGMLIYMVLLALSVYFDNLSRKEIIINAFIIAFFTVFISNLMFSQLQGVFFYFALALWCFYKPIVSDGRK